MSRISVEAKAFLPDGPGHSGLTADQKSQYTKVRILDRDSNGQEVTNILMGPNGENRFQSRPGFNLLHFSVNSEAKVNMEDIRRYDGLPQYDMFTRCFTQYDRGVNLQGMIADFLRALRDISTDRIIVLSYQDCLSVEDTADGRAIRNFLIDLGNRGLTSLGDFVRNHTVTGHYRLGFAAVFRKTSQDRYEVFHQSLQLSYVSRPGASLDLALESARIEVTVPSPRVQVVAGVQPVPASYPLEQKSSSNSSQPNSPVVLPTGSSWQEILNITSSDIRNWAEAVEPGSDDEETDDDDFERVEPLSSNPNTLLNSFRSTSPSKINSESKSFQPELG